ncbi:hypothetical protein OE88DRAFT_1643867 [Heliocybe sulcata]|uniref:CxC2-like cysteine cluster KDZ transposase-associated domain-containing protein n=1 Tax=Heliocybe sulcata TaxID=5364 RepID=A0A5C3NI00_9AGAM|nr:hypothetical protein OE88DRAFT_1643867 [Heliocybe sulcata]
MTLDIYWLVFPCGILLEPSILDNFHWQTPCQRTCKACTRNPAPEILHWHIETVADSWPTIPEHHHMPIQEDLSEDVLEFEEMDGPADVTKVKAKQYENSKGEASTWTWNVRGANSTLTCIAALTAITGSLFAGAVCLCGMLTYRCIAYKVPGHKDFTILHSTGIHSVQVDFCGCRHNPPLHRIQLLCARLWPVTPFQLQTSATFELLRLFQTLHLNAKISVLHFYQTMQWITDGSGLTDVAEWLKSLHLMIREYQHIQAMKRGGRGHDESGISGMEEGELALMCRTCPQPGINLLMGWEKARPDKAWNHLCKNQCMDRGLGDRMSYFVRTEPYHRYILSHVNDEEIKSCTGFSALIHTNLKKSKGLRTTGICGRSERYSNVDWVFVSAVHGIMVLMVLIAYDIACAWMKDMPDDMQLMLLKIILDYVMPKFHLEAHGKRCHAPYSLNYCFGVACTNCETPERNWVVLNLAALSTREMMPGGRQDTLDDLCGFMNWSKIVRLEMNLHRLLVAAIPQACQHCLAYNAFNTSLKREWPEALEKWNRMLEAWEADNLQCCPYDMPEEVVTLKEVQASLKLEEEANAEKGSGFGSERSVTALLVLGLDIEKARSTSGAVVNDIETQLRAAQLKDGLQSLRRHLRMQSYMNRFKIKNITGQYQCTHAAYLILNGPGDWELELQPLDANKDVTVPNERVLTEAEKQELEHLEEHTGHRAAHERDGNIQVGEGHHTLLWIWYAVPASGDANDAQMHDALRVEWAKAKAQVRCWLEELILVEEEMRRSIEYCCWKAVWWQERAWKVVAELKHIMEGNPSALASEDEMALAEAEAEAAAEMEAGRINAGGLPADLDDESATIALDYEDYD